VNGSSGPPRAQGSASPSGRPPRDPRSPAALGRPRLHLQLTDSTNDRARALAIAGAPHGTLVTASAQTAGRGRQGRRWSAPAHSSLLMSLLLRSPPPLLPLIAAVAICDVAGDAAMIKWPNDIVLVRAPAHEGAEPGASIDALGAEERATGGPVTDERVANTSTFAKLAGILIEGRPQQGWAVLGIGLNVAVRLDELPHELRSTAATLGESSDAIEPILERLLSTLQRRLASPVSEVLDAWRARDALRGRTIAWNAHGPEDRPKHGQADGIDGAGRLVVALPGGGRTTLEAGEVHLAS
jgi:BirA family transcriptional regulator, biotin operon repressor / biotin---[acetyl-CoA-carboxylase] ligase